jgi:hypothetical protein
VISHWCNVLRFVFTKFIHETTKGGKVNQRKVDLVQKPSTEASQHFDRRQRFVLDGLLKMKAAASDIQTAIRLFQEVDADNSGEYAPGCFAGTLLHASIWCAVVSWNIYWWGLV